MLEEARRLGFLGPGPIRTHLDHAEGFAEVIRSGGSPDVELRSAVDLGSGGGVPGLALALAFPASTWLLVDSARRRTDFLESAIDILQVADRVEVAAIRAEELGRQLDRRGRFGIVVARSFGRPAVTAECAAPLLVTSGRAVVSEPPDGGTGRWPVDGLGILGMTAGPRVRAAGSSFQVLEQRAPCPERYPRRVGLPAKRPLF